MSVRLYRPAVLGTLVPGPAKETRARTFAQWKQDRLTPASLSTPFP